MDLERDGLEQDLKITSTCLHLSMITIIGCPFHDTVAETKESRPDTEINQDLYEKEEEEMDQLIESIFIHVQIWAALYRVLRLPSMLYSWDIDIRSQLG